MNLYRFLFGIRAQLLYSLALIIFIVASSTYLFSITTLEQKFFEVRTQVLAFSMFVTNIRLPQPQLVPHAYAPTHALPSTTPTPTESPSPETVGNPDTQLVDCTGPDGQTLWLTQKDCDNFNDAWKGIPTSAATATDSATTN